MRLAFVVAPPLSASDGDRAPASSALGGTHALLAIRGFLVIDVATAAELESEFARAVACVTSEDTVLVQISASTSIESDTLRLHVARRGVEQSTAALRALGDALYAREPASVLFVVEARHEGDAGDAMLAADHVDGVVRALDARARGFSVLVGARSEAASATAPSVWPFVRFFTRAVEDARAKDQDGGTRISGVYESIRAMPEIAAFVQSFALVRGGTDFEIASARAEATPAPTSTPSPVSSPVLEHRLRLLHSLGDDAARVRELKSIARVQVEELADTRAAIETLEHARALVPSDLDVLESTAALWESLQRWPKVVELLGAMCDVAPTPADRARFRFAQAEITLGRLRDEARGIELIEVALEDDPRHEKALQAIVAVLTRLQAWPKLGHLYGNLVDRYAKLGDVERAWDICRRLGTLRRDKLRDGPGAIEAFTGAVTLKRADPEARVMLAELHLAKGDEVSALAELETVAVLVPSRPSTYTFLYDLHAKAGRRDRAWLAASVLGELGWASDEQKRLLDQLRPDGTLWPAKALGDEAWDALLRAPGDDHVVTGILGAIVPAAVKMRVAELTTARRLLALDPQKRQSASSTASIVRSFTWASQVLGVTLPDLYLLDSVPGGLAAAQVERPSTAIGPELTRGLTSQELSFFAGRHLSYYRPEHYALVFFPTLAELSALFLSAVKLALPEVPIPAHQGEAVARMRRELAKHSTPQEKEWLGRAVRELEARDGRVDLAAWIRSVELTAGRAGLLLCGDISVAVKCVKRESRAIAEVTAEDRRGDLLAFCASTHHGDLRARLVVTARPSSIPPPPRSSQASQ